MKLKNLVYFSLAVLVSGLLAVHRWGDSGHAIGVISATGGAVRHPAVMEGGKGHYSQITTVTVLPSFQGAARVALVGSPQLDYEIYLSRPVIDMGFRRTPELRQDILYDLRAGDRLSLWTLIKPASSSAIDENIPRPAELAGGFSEIFPFLKKFINGNASDSQTGFLKPSIQGRYHLAFYDAATGKPILTVPLIFTNPEKENGWHPE